MKFVHILGLSLACAAALPAASQTAAAPPPAAAPDSSTAAPIAGVPVYPYDITDRPYEVIGEVKAEVRKGTIFSKEASQEKVYRELWERGRKLKADAVIKANYGDSRVTLMSWGSIKATGTAIRFKPVDAASAPAAASAPM